MVSVRPLRKEDNFQDLVALSKAFFEEYERHREDFFEIDRLEDQAILDYFSLFLEQDDHAAFIALRNDRIVGYITVRVERQPAYWTVTRIGHISGLMVNKENRRQGIGGQLLDQAMIYFRCQRVRYYTLHTSVENRGAIQFYQARGMVPLRTELAGEVAKGS